jgi:hypothetical protein
VDWQEYQDAVGQFYESAEGLGTVRKNIRIPDKVTGQPRQVDALIEIEAKGHLLSVLIDAKFHKEKLDVKSVEEVASLAAAVSADKAVIVCANDWTEPAEKLAAFSSIDLKLWTMEDAVELIDPNKWQICPHCENDCIIMDQEGSLIIDSLVFWWLAGQCRECKSGLAWCQECGQQMLVDAETRVECYCGHMWQAKKDGMTLQLRGSDEIFDLRY